MNTDILFGKTKEHLVSVEGTKYLIHKDMIRDFLKLQQDAKEHGFDLHIASAFRDFDRQLKIWNSKASGERPILDKDEKQIDISRLTPKEIAFAILRWSAIPGCSRHHWGTDIDIYDRNTQSHESVKLSPSETTGNGPAAKMHDWLDDKFSGKYSYGFYRPYLTDRNGVSPERWHISYYSLSRRYLEAYTFSIFKQNLEKNEISLKEELLENADEIYHRFFLNTDLP